MPKAKQTVEDELVAVTEIKRKKNETRGQFIARLAAAVTDDKIIDDKWETISHEGQEWVNACARAIKAGQPLPPLAAGDKAEQPSSTPLRAAEPPSSEEDEPPLPLDGGAGPSPDPSAKPKRKAGGEKDGIMTTIKLMMLKDPKMSAAAIFKALEANGRVPSLSTVSTIRSDFRHSLRVLIDAGVLSIKLEL